MLIRGALLLCLLAVPACAPAIDLTAHDAAIVAAVKTALLNDPTIDGTRLSVRVDAGVVSLGGSLGSAGSVVHVLEVVRHLPGVREVRSTVRVDDVAAGGR